MRFPIGAERVTVLWMRVFVCGCAVLFGCSPAPLPEVSEEPWQATEGTCEASTLDAFAPCSTGSGLFGEWIIDAHGRPAYRYRFDQQNDERARFTNSEGRDRRDHWAAFGNQRVNALAFNDGHVEVVDQDRGVTHWNAWDEARRNYSGGFGWLDDGEATWCTAWKWRPQPSRTERQFGMVSARYAVEYRGVKSEREVFAPPGDDAVVISEVTLTNTSQRERKIAHYEYWDVARRNIEIEWIVSGDLAPEIPARVRAERDARNAGFREVLSWDQAHRALVLRRTPMEGVTRPDAGAPDPRDWYPADPFLAVLSGEVSGVFTEQAAFFAEGGPEAPAAVVNRAAPSPAVEGVLGRTTSGNGQRRLFVVKSELTLAPGEVRTLRFAYGTIRHGAPLEIPAGWGSVSVEDAQRALDPHLLRLAHRDSPFLTRELAWHSAQVEASVGRREYQGLHVVPQGSAYLYLHGADGAARDVGLFALPLVFTHTSLAREMLELNMQLQYGVNPRFSYAFQGHGMLDDALGIHNAPSDLDLFFLWALTEYVFATRDFGFLDQAVPYWPRESRPGATAWDHTRDAIRHLLDVVGTGPHGLIRVGTGDWSDGIVATYAPDRALAIRDGESVPNTQMALYVLPRAADLVEAREPMLAMELRQKVTELTTAVQTTWRQDHFGRAYFGDGALFRDAALDLEAQAWPMIAPAAFSAPTQRVQLKRGVTSQLTSPIGVTLTQGGEVWPAISVLWTWGLARGGDGALAWTHLAQNALHARARAFPQVWYGIWTGPDGVTSTTGEAWSSPATPMRDFPAQNNNVHALALFAALKAAGVDTTKDGLSIAPGGAPYELSSELLDLAWDGSRVSGTWRPMGAGTGVLDVRLGTGTSQQFVRTGGPVTFALGP
ncbi:MAG: hypothetical protein AMXMBFR34_20900 [Myxococcaceae bacterium]